MDEIMIAFNEYKGNNKRNDRIAFNPEIKVKRETDTLYIGEIKLTKAKTLMATVEVHNGRKTDKAPMPLNILSDVAKKQILTRLLHK